MTDFQTEEEYLEEERDHYAEYIEVEREAYYNQPRTVTCPLFCNTTATGTQAELEQQGWALEGFGSFCPAHSLRAKEVAAEPTPF